MAQSTEKGSSKAVAYLERLHDKLSPQRSHSGRSRGSVEVSPSSARQSRTTTESHNNSSPQRGSHSYHNGQGSSLPSNATGHHFSMATNESKKSRKFLKKKDHDLNSLVELNPVRSGHDGGAVFSNLAFRDVCDDDDDDDGDIDTREMESVVVDTVRSIKLGTEAVNDWLDYQNEIDENCSDVHKKIEEMRGKLVGVINAHAQKLHDELDSISVVYQNKAESVINDFDDVIQQMQRVLEEKVNHEDEAQTEAGLMKTRQTLEKLNHDLENLEDDPPAWSLIELQSLEHSPKVMTRLVGCLQGVPIDFGWSNGIDKAVPKPQILHLPIQKGTFTAQTPKDSRECGIVDIAITEDKQVLVVDKHNRLVKIFDFHGNFEGYLGRDRLKEPSRVTVLANTGNVLVTDNSSKVIKLFHKDGQYVNDFVSELKQPAGLCQLPDGSIAVVEFVTKSVIIYDQSGKQLQAFTTDTSCPAFISCTLDSHILISDWRLNVLKVYDVTGCEIQEVNGYRSAEGQLMALKEPQGICADIHGHIILTDKKNHRVLLLDKDGDYEYSYCEPECKFKLPMSVSCNRHGLLVVAEYQGCIKLLQYLDVQPAMPSAPSGEKAVHSHGKNTSIAVPEDVTLEPKRECETVC